MIVIQRGESVYTLNDDKTGFKELPLSYTKWPTEPTPESCNESSEWLLEFLARGNYPYGFRIHDEESRGPMEPTTLVYGDIMQGNSIKLQVALYTVANAITLGTEQSLETTLKTSLSKP